MENTDNVMSFLITLKDQSFYSGIFFFLSYILGIKTSDGGYEFCAFFLMSFLGKIKC